jgi:hypothetical protein
MHCAGAPGGPIHHPWEAGLPYSAGYLGSEAAGAEPINPPSIGPFPLLLMSLSSSLTHHVHLITLLCHPCVSVVHCWWSSSQDALCMTVL